MNKPLWPLAPSMARRHYNYIAEAIQELDVSDKVRKKIAYHFAGRLMRTNNRFKYDKFVAYATQKPTLKV